MTRKHESIQPMRRIFGVRWLDTAFPGGGAASPTRRPNPTPEPKNAEMAGWRPVPPAGKSGVQPPALQSGADAAVKELTRMSGRGESGARMTGTPWHSRILAQGPRATVCFFGAFLLAASFFNSFAQAHHMQEQSAIYAYLACAILLMGNLFLPSGPARSREVATP